MLRRVVLLIAGCAIVAPLSLSASVANAQSDEEHAGHSRGGYAWGQEHQDDGAASGPLAHHYGRGFLSLGVGGSVRMIQYLTPPFTQDWLAPSYLQLRGGYFFESDGIAQHGVVLGVATTLGGDGTLANGVDPFGQWSLAPAYMVRLIPDGELGDYFQATGRIGIPLALSPGSTPASTYFSWGLEAGVGLLIKPWDGFGFYGEIGVSMYFANDPVSGFDVHPLVSFEWGIMLDLPEMLP